MEEQRVFGTVGGGFTPPPAAPENEHEYRSGEDVPEPGPAPQLSSLDMLREAVEQREAAPAPDLCLVPLPNLPWRLVCDPEFSYNQYRDWQKAGLPIKQRRGNRPPNPLDMDQAVTAGLILMNTCVAIEMRASDDSWVTVRNSQGAPVTIKDPEFLDKFNVLDPALMLRKLFTEPGRNPDAPMLEASQQIIIAAGYAKAEDDGPDSDPTG